MLLPGSRYENNLEKSEGKKYLRSSILSKISVNRKSKSCPL